MRNIENSQDIGRFLFSAIYSLIYNYKNPKRIRVSPACLFLPA